MAEAGTIVFNIDGNSAKLLRALKQSERETKKSSRRIKQAWANAGKAAAASIAAIGASMVVASKRGLEYADTIGKLSTRLAVGAETLQEWRFAAKRTGVDASQLDKGLEMLARRAGEASQGIGEGKQAFEILGVTLRDSEGRLKNVETMFYDVADGISNIRDQTLQADLAAKIFGRAGVRLLNMLRDGSVAIKDFGTEARNMGAVLREDLVRQGEAATDAMGDLGLVLQVRIAEAVTENAESIIDLANALITFVGAVSDGVKAWDDWLATMGVGVSGMEDIELRQGAIADRLKEINKELREIGDIKPADMSGFLSSHGTTPYMAMGGLFGEDPAKRKARLEAEKAQILKEAAELRDAMNEAIEQQNKRGETAARTFLNPEGFEAAGKEVQDKVANFLQSLDQEIRAFGKSDEDTALIKLIDDGATEQQIQQAMILLNELKLLKAEEESAQKLAEQRKAMGEEYLTIVQQTRTETELHNEAIARVAELYEAGIIPSATEYAEIVRRIGEDFVESQDKSENMLINMEELGRSAARNIHSEFAEFLFDPFDKGLKGMLQGFGQMIQRMVAEVLAAQILQSFFGSMGGMGAGGDAGGFLGGFASIFGGALAKGGHMDAGRAYLVGEKGPELVIPSESGTVIPNEALRGVGNSYHTTVNLPATLPQRTAQQVAYEVAQKQKRAEVRNG